MAWIPIPGTKYFSEDGNGVYEKLGGKTSDGLYLRSSPPPVCTAFDVSPVLDDEETAALAKDVLADHNHGG